MVWGVYFNGSLAFSMEAGALRSEISEERDLIFSDKRFPTERGFLSELGPLATPLNL